MDLKLFGKARQTSVPVVDEGVEVPVRVDRTGVAITWKESLVMEGRCFAAAFGEMGATDITELTAGSDLDQPDFGISVPAGTTLIPLEINIAAKAPMDADDADLYFIVIGDPDAEYADDGTVTAVTPMNLITSNPIGSLANVFEDSSANITDPICTKIIVCGKQVQAGAMEATETGAVSSDLNIHYQPDVPYFFVGPAAIYGFGGGADTVTWAGSVVWAEVPSSRFAQ